MQKDGSMGAMALIASIALHSLLLLVQWQPAQVVELLPLEGSGVVELAEISPAKGQPSEQIVQEQPEVEETKTAPAKKEPAEPAPTAAAPSQPEQKRPAEPKAEVMTSQGGATAVPAQQSAPVQPEEQAPAEAVPQGPTYPGDDPTGEAMVASKRAITYPKESMSSSSEGDVLLEAYVLKDGTIARIEVIGGPDDARLKEMATITISRYWTFKPAERAYKVAIEVSFRMEPVAAATPRFISASFLD
ncbi:MAG: TonB family protein [Firmicutes bacterium]|nr:TonB family protein [Bacillota bacterium]